ncbi:MAG: TonB-dependent receptor [Steroidobacteraceae bacterium]
MQSDSASFATPATDVASTSKYVRRAVRAALGLLALAPLASFAADATDEAVVAANNNAAAIGEVIVFGRGEELIGKADAASEGAVGGDDLLVRPMLRVADLLEAVPGMIAAQHSGSGKANQYFLRGFNLDHGTDFTAYIDDVPWNLRTHGHGQGYLDVNGLIPEVVERIEYRKGPYRADNGDFSMAGAALMTTIDNLQRPFVAIETGQYGWGRVAGGGTTNLGSGMLTLLGQYKTYDGPWELKEDLQHESVWGKYTQPTDYGMLKASLSGYHATWKPTEQSPERVIGTSVCEDEFCALDTTAKGETLRWIGDVQLLADDWRATVWGQYYDWRMSSNPTYDYQIDQFDRRWIVGGRYERNLLRTDKLEVKAGTELRYDNIGNVGVDHDVDGEFSDNIARNSAREGSIGVYSEATWRATDALRFTGGLRGDYYNFNVGLRPGSGEIGQENVGKKSDSNFSPKVGVAYAVNNNVELYGNWGQGAHSNDARGVVRADSEIKGLAIGTGYEAGARFEVGDFKITTAYWWLNLSSELIFVGDDNSVEPRGGSKRHGYEVVAFWRPKEWLAIDAVYTGSQAHYVDFTYDDDTETTGGHNIEGSVKSAGELGIAATKGAWEFSGRLRYLGGYALVPSNTQKTDAETMLNLRAARKFEHITIYGEVLNALDHKGKDIVYYYGTNVAGYDPTPDPDDLDATRVDGRVSRAEEPRTLRVGLKYEF